MYSNGALAKYNLGRGSWQLEGENAGTARIETNDSIDVADDGTLTVTLAECGACIVHVYDVQQGHGAVYFVSYNGGAVLMNASVSSNFATSDVDGKYCLYKSTGHYTTFKNRTGSTKPMSILVVGAQASK